MHSATATQGIHLHTPKRAPKRVLPGFKLTLGYTLFYLSLIVLIPLSALVLKTFTLTWEQFWTAVASPRVVASYQLTFGALDAKVRKELRRWK
jgi:sulfate transport system permease protein